MPSDDLLWAGIVLSGLLVLVSYYVVVWARSVRKQIGRVSESCNALDSRFVDLRSDVGALTREISDKANLADVDAYCAGFAASHSRKSKMVIKRG